MLVSQSSTWGAVVVCIHLLAALMVLATYQTSHAHLIPVLRKELVRTTTWCAVLCLWPLAWSALTGPCASCTYVGLVWPLCIMMADVTVRYYACSPRAGINIEPNSLTGVTFAMAGMVGAVSDPKRIRLFVLPIVILLCFIVPAPTGLPDDSLRACIETVQQAFITCATATLVSGIMYRHPTLIRLDERRFRGRPHLKD